MFGFGLDPIYLIFMVPALLLGLFAQWRVSSAYQKYSQVANARGLTGADTARVLMQSEGLGYLNVEGIAGNLTDHYDPRAKTVRLSEGSSAAPSIAAMAVVAHELGHALQDKQGYFWLNVRGGIVGLANIGSQLGTMLFFGGLLLASFVGSNFGFSIAWIGVLFMSAGVVFALVTLPVEFDASRRAREMLARNGLISPQEADGVKAVLDAAALTYVASAAQAVMQLIYWVSLLNRSRDNYR